MQWSIRLMDIMCTLCCTPHSASDLYISHMYRYNELMFTIETCQAASMIHKIYSPNIVASGSSRVGEDALSVSRVCVMCVCESI